MYIKNKRDKFEVKLRQLALYSCLHVYTLFSTTTYLEAAVYIMLVHNSPFDFGVHVLKKILQEQRDLSKRFYRQRLSLFVYCWIQRWKLRRR